MTYRILADITVILHLVFVVFAVSGGFLLTRWFVLIWLHIPALFWALLVELMGWFCPLTPLENYFRQLAGQEGYAGGFIEHYLIPVLYPQQNLRIIQYTLAFLVLFLNVAAYYRLYRRRKSMIE